MELGTHQESISREGGTGLHKLLAILSVDLQATHEPNLEFGFASSGRFFVRFAAPLRLLTVPTTLLAV
jgi:hypothetical protein